MTTTLVELEARVAALEAGQADYKAVMAAVNVLTQQTRERFDSVHSRIDAVGDELSDFRAEVGVFRRETKARFRSIDDNFAELKDLIVRALDR